MNIESNPVWKRSRRSRRVCALLLIASLALLNAFPARGGELSGPYIKPEYQLPFGQQSHWIQPWRGYLETMPAHHFVNGVGIVLNLDNGENADVICQHLARYGVKQARLEFGWSDVNSSETGFHGAQRKAELLRACQKWGLRPLILLNGNHGAPGPTEGFDRTVTVRAEQGARTVTLNDVSELVPKRSGFNFDGVAAGVLITAVNGQTVTLSKPLPRAFEVGESVPMSTLKYEPFGVPGAASTNATLEGWKRYVRLAAGFTRDALAPGSGSKTFDMEIWNELSFGSDFLHINRYYEPDIAAYPNPNEEAIYPVVVGATADVANANPALFSGVRLSNGFSNTIPSPNASTQPARVTAISKHPYPHGSVQWTRPANAAARRSTRWAKRTLPATCRPITPRFPNTTAPRFKPKARFSTWGR